MSKFENDTCTGIYPYYVTINAVCHVFCQVSHYLCYLLPNPFLYSIPLLQFPFAQEHNIIFVVSTTGEGEPPDHALRYWRKLKRKTLPPDYLKHINYTLLGEGFVGRWWEGRLGNMCWVLGYIIAFTMVY